MELSSVERESLVAPCLPVDHRWAMLPARMFIFDLDDTLAPSKSPLPDQISSGLSELLEYASVCIISGGHFTQFEKQVIERLALSAASRAKLHLMPTCGTRYYVASNDSWKQVYAEDLSEADRRAVIEVLVDGAQQLGLWESQPWGQIIEDRGSQITFSALGQAAPVAEKSAWDPDGRKKSMLRQYAADKLPELEVRSGGSTSIDVTRRGIDKAYGVGRLLREVGLSVDDVLFVGDRLDVDGNDYPVRRLGIRCVQVSNWQQTALLLLEWNRLAKATA